ncbi:MAG: hypothetical protein N2200_01425 [Bacteroidia bacterium]|nr:hypothetical protein [Bacteroidia bacterium]MDW8416814.1 hypothetical protein [Bacteroidia bacterium]
MKRGRGPLVAFVPERDATDEGVELLRKITNAVNIPWDETTVVLTRYALSLGRIALFSQSILWVFGEKVPPFVSYGVYDLRTSQLLPPPQFQPGQGQRYLYILPALSEMQQSQEKKKRTWEWIKGLASES